MTGPSSQPSDIIALPPGGGALRGIGETFSPDLHSGTGNFSVPIATPPGRHGLQPALTLAYSTGRGNGPFGLGWSLSIPGVSRKTSKGVPRYDDARDTFVLSGAEDLVPLPGASTGATRYRPRTEGPFVRIEHRRDGGNDYWEVRSQDGLVNVYGTPERAGADPAVVADPVDRSRVQAWNLSRTVDSFGNRLEYEYERDHGADGPHEFDQLYLRRVRYVDYTEGGADAFLVSVTFVYEDRPDPFSEYRGGFEARTRRRCVSIETRTHAGEARLVRTVHLVYLDQRAGMESARPLSGVSLLSRIRVVGHDDGRTEELPPLDFDYTRFEPEARTFARVEGSDLPAVSLAHRDYELADLFGHGLPDILNMNGTVRYWRNLGGGRFDLPREMADAPAGLQLAAKGVQLLDADGDGRTDVMVVTEGMAGYFPLRFDGLWDRRSFQRYRQAPSFDLNDPEVRLLDLDGDGVTDALRSGTRLECFFNDAKDGWTETRFVERQAVDAFPNVNFSDPRVRLADMTGDGLQDVVLVHDGSIAYWPNLGRGNWGRQVIMRRSPRLPEGFDPRRLLLGDVDGDGAADLVLVEDTRVTLWINQCGNGWSDPRVIKGTPPLSDVDAVRLTDLGGNGVSGILWSYDAGGRSRGTLFFLDLTGGTKPCLLAEIDNHLGALTRVDYAPSTRFYLEDQKRPATRWKTPLPFPVHVVARVEVVDAISGGTLTTEYRYRHGYWDGAEREFRGFGRVDQRDTEAGASSPPLETRTWFHQGPVGDESEGWQECDYTSEYWPGDPQVLERPPGMALMLGNLPHRARRDALRTLRGSILRTELYALDGTERQDRPYTVSENLHGVREESPEIFFPHVLAQRTTQWERGDEPMTRFQFTDDYDAYGQARSETSIAVPRGRDPRVASAPIRPYLATHRVTAYAHRDDAGRYLIARAARITTHEIGNDGSPDVFTLHAGIVSGAGSRRVIGQTLNFFDGPAFEGLAFGQLGDHGVPSRSERLVLSEDILGEAYPTIPPYFAPAASPAWTAEYPQEFRDLLPPLAGYVFQPGGAGSACARGYFMRTERRRYDCQENATGQGRGLPTAGRDPLGRDTTVTYDAFDLLPTETTGPTGLTVRARHDYRVLQPREVTDANGNRRLATYTPLGLVASTAVMGKDGESAGDTPDAPSVRMVYDFLAFAQRGQPISVRSIRRVHHASATDAPLPERDDTIETVEYSDGFGRLLQTRTQADDVVFGDAGLPVEPPAALGDAVGRARATGGPTRVVVSGWQIYDNKGRVVEKYEPFFSTDWPYSPPTDAQLGQKATMEYDPRGEVVRTVNPDGSQQRVVFGIPVDLAEPDRFAPTPWESYTYDANDNAGRTHPAVSGGFQHHWNTPASAEVDALGRVVTAIVRNGPDAGTDWLVTRSTYDIRGNVLTITDPLNRAAFRHVYDLLDRVLRSESIDAGTRRAVLDAAGNAVEGRDSKGALVLRSHDGLNRPIRLWARDAGGEPVTLRERILFGDAADSGLTRAQAAAANLLGRPLRHYDEAGLLTLESCDFKGNVLEKTRRVIADAAILAVFDRPSPPGQETAFRVDWQPPTGVTLERHAGTLLDATTHRTSATYDARDRLETLRYPETVDGERKELRPRYSRAGGLESVRLDGAIFVDRIAYNATGQRVLIAYGNGVMTRSAYHPRTFRLTRLRTERFTRPDALTWHPSGPPLQDFAYRHDVSGNITDIQDRAPGSGIPNTALGPDALDRAFTYDPLYRLLSATGRECDAPPPDPWDGAARGTDLTRTRAYTERYDYDDAGNLTRLRHQNSIGGSVRELAPVPAANRLATATTGQTVLAYAHDPNGNLVTEAAARRFEWDHGDRMKTFRTQSGGAEPSVHAHYLYDPVGQRVKKLVRKQGGQIETTVSVDGLFEHHRTITAGTTRENNTLHVMDDQRRVALVRVGAPFPGDTTPAVKFHLGDHLGSSHVVVDGAGALVNREEFTPYGDTSFGSFARKRFRFTGKERDEESGLNHQGVRYYAPWLARWTSCDPAGTADGPNLYAYVRNNPMRLVDPTGMQGEDDNMSHKPCECSRAPAKPKNTSPEGNASSAKPPNYTPVPKKKAPAPSNPAPSTPAPSTENTWASKFSLDLVKPGPSPLDFYQPSAASQNAAAPPLSSAPAAPTGSGMTSADGATGSSVVGGFLASLELKIDIEAAVKSFDPSWLNSADAQSAAMAKYRLNAAGGLLNIAGAIFAAKSQSTKTTATTPLGKAVEIGSAGVISYAFGRFFPITAGADAAVGGLTGGQLSIGGTIQGVTTFGITAIESIITGDMSGAKAFRDKMMKGGYGLGTEVILAPPDPAYLEVRWDLDLF